MTNAGTEKVLRIAVTGARGFVGARAVVMLKAIGHDVWQLQRTVEGREAEQAIACDISHDDPALVYALRGFDALVHLAAYIPANYEDMDECQRCFNVNALGTLRLLQAAEGAGIRHFIHASTAALYAPASRAADERSLMLPDRSVAYLGSKLAAEAYVAHFASRGTLNHNVLRFSSVYGPGMAEAGLIPKCFWQLKTTGHFVVADADRYRCDLVHVDDAVGAIVSCLRRPSNHIYNVGAGELSSPLQVATIMAGLLGVDTAGITVAEADTKSGPGIYCGIDIDAAKRDLGHAPRSLSQGLASYIRGWL